MAVQGQTVSFSPPNAKCKCLYNNSSRLTTHSMIVGALTCFFLAVFLGLVVRISAAMFWPSFLLMFGFEMLHIGLIWELDLETRPYLLIPYMVGQVLAMVYLGMVLVLVVMNVAGAVTVTSGRQPMSTEEISWIYAFLAILLLFLVMGIQILFFLELKASFHYFKNKLSHRSADGGEQGNSGRYHKNGTQDSAPPAFSEK